MSFASNLAALMAKRGWTNTYVGKRADVSRQAVAGWLKGSPPRQVNVERLMAAEGISYEALFGSSGGHNTGGQAPAAVEERIAVRKGPPVLGEPLDDVDELALIGFWRGLSITKKAALFAYLGADDMPSLREGPPNRKSA